MPELPPALIQHWPELIPLAIVVYGSVVLLIVTTLLFAGIVQTRLHLRNARTREELLEAFAQSGLEHLLTRILDLAPFDVSGGRIVIQTAFRANQARREIMYLYRRRLIRVHFFTAVAALLIFAAFSWMQDYTAIAKLGIMLSPVVLTAAAALGLALFCSIGHLLINAAGQPLLGKISEIPMERIEITWIRMLTTILEQDAFGHLSALKNDSIARIQQLLEQLNETIDRHSRSIYDSALHFSATAEALNLTVKAFSEQIPALSVHEPNFKQFGKLNAAVDRPTTELQGPTPAARCSSVRPGGNGSDNSQISAHPNLKQQLHDLIKEFE